MELIPQLKLVADNEAASKRTEILLVGKILSEKSFTENEVFMVVRRVWFTKELPKVEEVNKNTFLFTFKSVYDRNRVWSRRPWSINKAHLLLKEWMPDRAINEIAFDSSTFWVQIKALPNGIYDKE